MVVITVREAPTNKPQTWRVRALQQLCRGNWIFTNWEWGGGRQGSAEGLSMVARHRLRPCREKAARRHRRQGCSCRIPSSTSSRSWRRGTPRFGECLRFLYPSPFTLHPSPAVTLYPPPLYSEILCVTGVNPCWPPCIHCHSTACIVFLGLCTQPLTVAFRYQGAQDTVCLLALAAGRRARRDERARVGGRGAVGQGAVGAHPTAKQVDHFTRRFAGARQQRHGG